MTKLEKLAEQAEEIGRQCNMNPLCEDFIITWNIPGEGIETEKNYMRHRSCLDHVRGLKEKAPVGTIVEVRINGKQEVIYKSTKT
jgi:hypothetical protein